MQIIEDFLYGELFSHTKLSRLSTGSDKRHSKSWVSA